MSQGRLPMQKTQFREKFVSVSHSLSEWLVVIPSVVKEGVLFALEGDKLAEVTGFYH